MNERPRHADGDRPLRVAFETLGCRSNYADTVDLQAALVEHGAVPCSFDAPADVYVINTCTVTDDADKSALRLIRRARSLAPDARIVVTGCLAEAGGDRVANLRAADAIIGPGRRRDVLSAILETGEPSRGSLGEPVAPPPAASKIRSRTGRKRLVPFISDSLCEELPKATAGPGSAHGEVPTRARFHLRVQEGCENSCTFCIIPTSRGGLVSRRISLVLDDVRRLHAAGYREVVLTGTHLGGFGEDSGLSLTELLQVLDRESPIRRIRLSSIDPNDVTPQLIDILASGDAFCRHLHICVQAFSDPVLKRMNRRYRLSQVYEIIRYVGERLPGCCLGSDVIAGFPGESRQDVDQAIDRFLELPFSYLHVFPYSERAGTAAVRLDGAVPPDERKRRAARWRALGDRRRAEFHQSLVGRQVEIVVESIEMRGAEPHALGTTREFATASAPLRTIQHSGDVTSSLVGRTVTAVGAVYHPEEGCLLCA